MASFYTYIPDPEDYVICPYDKVHVIRHKKLPYHLMKCRKNFPNQKMMVCHFNARHEIPEAEFRFHLTSCPDKHAVERIKDYEKLNRDATWIAGNNAVPTYFPDVEVPEPTEDWDSEVQALHPRIGVDPRSLAGYDYIKPLTNYKPSQKKAYYANLAKGDMEANVKLVDSVSTFNMEANVDSVNGVSDTEAVTNTTNNTESSNATPASEFLSLAQTKQANTFAQPALGRGRGRGLRNTVSTLATPGATASGKARPVEAPIQLPVHKQIRKLRKKIREAERLIERQAKGEALNEEERVKVAMKTTLEFKLTELESVNED